MMEKVFLRCFSIRHKLSGASGCDRVSFKAFWESQTKASFIGPLSFLLFVQPPWAPAAAAPRLPVASVMTELASDVHLQPFLLWVSVLPQEDNANPIFLIESWTYRCRPVGRYL